LHPKNSIIYDAPFPTQAHLHRSLRFPAFPALP
jgi:hypothetical protein